MNAWTGRIYSATRDTVDGRRIEPQAIAGLDTRYTEADPIPLMWEEGGAHVGTVEGITEVAGVGVAVGQADLPPGVYHVAMQLSEVEVEIPDDWPDNSDAVQVLTAGRVRCITILQDPTTAAWHDAQIVVHGRST